MAEITPQSSLAEVINSLDLAGVPEKLHCSTCQGFLLNAYKTSCCEQNICERCFHQITDHCLMCKHKPFSKELCRPAKAMRNTVKAYLRSVEKSLVDERTKAQTNQGSANEDKKPDGKEVADAQAEANREVENGTLDDPPAPSEEPAPDQASLTADVQQSIETGSLRDDQQPQSEQSPPGNDVDTARDASVESDANDDEVEIQVEPAAGETTLEMSQIYELEEQEQRYDNSAADNSKNGDLSMHEMSNGTESNGFNMQNTNTMGFNNMGMDMNMMQQMMNMNMNMMSMGMNPMFGAFGGSNGSMNGMNMMNMNFNPNQMFNGWNGQNSNMWQNNNAMNAMGGDFGSQFGSNMSQQGNFYSQQFPNGDFNSYNGRPGRGRFRGGRGSYGRGRGNFNQYQQNYGFQHNNEQAQYDAQNTQTQITPNVNGQDEKSKGHDNSKEEETHDQDDFAPGGQDEVQEALGSDHQDSKEDTQEVSPTENDSVPSQVDHMQDEAQVDATPTVSKEQLAPEKPIPEAYHEDFENMAPPSAPTGPSGRYSDKEFAFRARGHSKYASRSRGSFSASVGFPASPIRSISQSSITAPSPPNKGVGVVGAPTGPRAMREPTVAKPPPRPPGNNGGFQIMGRASMQSQATQPRDDEQHRSASPTNGYDDYEDERSTSRRHLKHDKYIDNRNEADLDSNYDYDRSDRERDRRSKRSSRVEYRDDQEMQDVDQDFDSPDRKSSHKSSRYDKERSRRDEKYSTSSKHRSSRRQYDDDVESDRDRDDYDELMTEKHRTSRNGKSSGRHDSTRDRDKDSHRDRKRDRDRDRERERDRDREEDRSKDKEDRHRKRSRNDRDREDEYDDPDEEESRYRSRRYKRDHLSSSRKERDRDVDESDLGLRISGRSNSNRQSTLPTPTSATSSLPPTSVLGSEKDPHTLEREARNRERMQKEQQRREKAALDKRGGPNAVGSKGNSRTTTSGGRRVSYKYEDEVERGMGAVDEREKARWR